MQEKAHAALKEKNQKLLATLSIKMFTRFQQDFSQKKKKSSLKKIEKV